MSIRTKLLILFTCLIILPLIVLTAVVYNRSAAVILNQSLEAASRMLDQAFISTSYQVERMRRVAIFLSTDAEILSILTEGGRGQGMGEQLDDYNTLRETIDTATWNGELTSLRVYAASSAIYTSERYRIYDLDSIRGETWFETSSNRVVGPPVLRDGGTVTVGAGSDVHVISLAMLIRDPRALDRIVAAISADVARHEFDLILSNNILTPGAAVAIESSSSAIVASVGLSEDGPVSPDSYHHLSGGPDGIAVVGGEYIVGIRSAESGVFRLVSIVPLSEVLQGSRRLRNEVLVIAAAISLVAASAGLVATTRMSGRIHALSAAMASVEDGTLSARVDTDSSDELGQLQHGFNLMTDRLEALVQERFESGRRTKLAEIKALQSQINPHFLYNSLDLVAWMSYVQGATEINKLARDLARFYKLSLRGGEDFVPVREEIEHAKVYATIENTRYDQAVRLEVDVNPAAADCTVPKLIVQPLVENAFQHGIREKPDRSGCVRIRAVADSATVTIVVEDDGVGFDPVAIERALTHDEANSAGGYGLYNINERLRLTYGSPFGVHLSRVDGTVTRATIIVPISTPG